MQDSTKVVYDIVIVGLGPAASTAGLYSLRNNLKTLMIGETFGGATLVSGEIENWPGIVNTTGFELAEKDLALRGPGQFFGASQSGLPDLSMASLLDLVFIKQVRLEAAKILKSDPALKNYPILKEKLDEFQVSIHLE